MVPNHPSVTVHTLRSPWGLVSPVLAQQTGRTWLKTNQIQKVLSSKKFDIIHYHNISLLGPEVLRLNPVHREFLKVYTTHEHWLVCPMHVLWKNNERLCDGPQCIRCTLRFHRPPQLWRYTKFLENCLESVDTFFSPSRFTLDIHRERGFARINHLPHFVPRSDLDSPVFNDSPHPRPYFLFVGRLEKIKGLQTLIPIFYNYPHADLLVAGSGDYDSELRRQAAGTGNVFFLGTLPQAELQRLYRHAIAAIVPSICYEVFGMIVLEAFRERTPVIVRGLGALQEIVRESQAGLTYQTQDELLASMERLRINAELRNALGQQGFTKYQELWSEDVHLESYIRILEETADRKFGYVPWRRESRPAIQATVENAQI